MMSTARGILVVAALALAAPVWADESSSLLRYRAATFDRSNNVTPPGAPSTEVTVSCLAAAGRFRECSVVSQQHEPPRDDVAAQAIKVAMAARFDGKDRQGNPVAGRRFEFEAELLAPCCPRIPKAQASVLRRLV